MLLMILQTDWLRVRHFKEEFKEDFKYYQLIVEILNSVQNDTFSNFTVNSKRLTKLDYAVIKHSDLLFQVA